MIRSTSVSCMPKKIIFTAPFSSSSNSSTASAGGTPSSRAASSMFLPSSRRFFFRFHQGDAHLRPGSAVHGVDPVAHSRPGHIFQHLLR
jgi:hypothetical protein